jgi:hypothetical protein
VVESVVKRNSVMNFGFGCEGLMELDYSIH